MKSSDQICYTKGNIYYQPQPFVALIGTCTRDDEMTKIWNKVLSFEIPRAGPRPCQILLAREMGWSVEQWIDKMLNFDWSNWIPKPGAERLETQKLVVPFTPSLFRSITAPTKNPRYYSLRTHIQVQMSKAKYLDEFTKRYKPAAFKKLKYNMPSPKLIAKVMKAAYNSTF